MFNKRSFFQIDFTTAVNCRRTRSLNMKRANPQSDSSSRTGFTLVEMLVSVALILLMMTMFASIFQLATDSVSTQQAIGESDQRVRSITTVIRADFAKRTMIYPLPFYPTEDLDLGPKSPGLREGFVYISTNDPDCLYDDKIQFTVRSNLTSENTDETEYVGAAQPLIDREGGAGGVNLYQNPNQPEVDDGSLTADFASSSPAAQICYFVRNGNLYRRVTMIRNPRRVAGGELGPQPTSSAGNNFFGGIDGGGIYDGRFQVIGGGTTNDFPRNFDFSAVAGLDLAGNQFAEFLGTESLSNRQVGAGAAVRPLGNPINRFGFNQLTGFSREHDSLARRIYIGTFTHAETSVGNFNWPMNVTTAEGSSEATLPLTAMNGNGNPFNLAGNPMTLQPGNNLVDELDANTQFGGVRRMEDLLLANVHEFAIEIWDERANRFVIPGYGSLSDPDSVVGDYHIRRNLHFDAGSTIFNYGPLAPYDPSAANEADRQPHVFDTWTPQFALPTAPPTWMDLDADGASEMSEIQAPYNPYVIYPPRQNDAPEAGPSSPRAPAFDPPPLGLNPTGYWDENSALYNVGDVVFARLSIANPGWDANGDGAFHWVTDAPFIPPQGYQVAYRCIQAGRPGLLPPIWPSTPGKRVAETPVVAPGSDPPAVWESFDNRRPLKAVRFKIRFINQKSGDPRQLTLVLPLTDT